MSDDLTPILFLSEGRKINISELASDLVLFGGEDIDGVLRAHGIDELQLAELIENSPALRTQIQSLRKKLEADPHAVIRMKASSALEGHINTLNLMAAATENEPKDRHAAIRLLAELADALPKAAQKGPAGMVVQFNLGDMSRAPTVKPVNVLEG